MIGFRSLGSKGAGFPQDSSGGRLFPRGSSGLKIAVRLCIGCSGFWLRSQASTRSNPWRGAKLEVHKKSRNPTTQ